MTVHRFKPLPKRALRGRVLVGEHMIADTRQALTDFALAGLRDGGHEGIVFWAGRELGDSLILASVIVPRADHSPQRVLVDLAAFAAAARSARAAGLGILCQVHSHPGDDARHSDGDDDLIRLPFEGMLSIVVRNYGIGFSSLAGACVHQYQDSRWVLCTSDSVQRGVILVPGTVNLNRS